MSVIKRDSRTSWPSLDFAWPEDRIDHVLRDMFRDVFAGRSLAERFAEGVANSLHVEEFVEDGSCVIRVEIPGIDPDKDVEITMADGVLNISAQREERNEEERPSGYRSEFRYGSFRRTLRLPQGVQQEDVKATYKDGILEIRLPMAEPHPEPTKVPIEHA